MITLEGEEKVKNCLTFKQNNDILEQIIMDVDSINERLLVINNPLKKDEPKEYNKEKEYTCILEKINNRLETLNSELSVLKNFSYYLFNKLYSDVIKETIDKILCEKISSPEGLNFNSVAICNNITNLQILLKDVYTIEILYDILFKCFFSQSYGEKLNEDVIKEEFDQCKVDVCEEIPNPAVTEHFYNKLNKMQQSISNIKSVVIEIEKLFN